MNIEAVRVIVTRVPHSRRKDAAALRELRLDLGSIVSRVANMPVAIRTLSSFTTSWPLSFSSHSIAVSFASGAGLLESDIADVGWLRAARFGFSGCWWEVDVMLVVLMAVAGKEARTSALWYLTSY